MEKVVFICSEKAQFEKGELKVTLKPAEKNSDKVFVGKPTGKVTLKNISREVFEHFEIGREYAIEFTDVPEGANLFNMDEEEDQE